MIFFSYQEAVGLKRLIKISKICLISLKYGSIRKYYSQESNQISKGIDQVNLDFYYQFELTETFHPVIFLKEVKNQRLN